MALPEEWAKIEDFATLFQYFWHRDFPIGPTAGGARRVDWTIHIGVVIRNIADLMGLYSRFEVGKRDAVIRSIDPPPRGDEIAVEWEWERVVIKDKELKGLKELCDLKNYKAWGVDKDDEVWRERPERLLKYAVLVTYTDKTDPKDVYTAVGKRWEGARWPLLLILIEYKKSKVLATGREFQTIRMSKFDCEGQKKDIRDIPALPESTKYSLARVIS